MAKQTGRPKKRTTPKKDREWFERKVAELRAGLEKLPADRQAELMRDWSAASDRRPMKG